MGFEDMLQIAVIGDSEADKKALEIAEEVGKLLAQKGVIVLSGGRGGVMEAVFKGAKANKGTTVGILPGPEKSEANIYTDITIVTNMGWTRNSLIQLSSDGVIVIGGKAGTLCEIAFAWMYGKPIVALPSAGGWGAKLAGTKIDERRSDRIESAHSPQQAVERLLEILEK
ncbi:MAG: TIGR00725 family protein [Candidatus Ranarchaeia archaeon]|jgi:uncharacterized protein (TIGR00725 family)